MPSRLVTRAQRRSALGLLHNIAFGVLLAAVPASGEELKVDPDAGNSTVAAVFDAPLGERINAVSSTVSCTVSLDPAASGNCSVPLASVRVDNDDTKTGHFQQWATNKKSDPKQCTLEARFSAVPLDGPLIAEKPVRFSAEVPFTICGRSRRDGGKEHVEGTAILFPAGSYGPAKTIRIRARVEKFNRDLYGVGPKYTEGWLARVQQLAKVVADEGSIELNLFAKAAPAASN